MALEIGFDACGIAQVAPIESEALYFDQWLADGCHAGMRYMENYRDIRLNPTGLVEEAKSIIAVALNYYPAQKLSEEIPHIAYYAYGKDYHIVVKEMLQRLWEKLLLKSIIPGKGSFFFLGELVTTCKVDVYDTPQRNRCGNCTRCLGACPTGALEQERRLNANKCLSYLTIEHRGEIPTEKAAQLGNRIYGCDTCQEVCPWNRFARPTQITAFHPSSALLSIRKEDLTELSREDYNRIFAQSAVKRAKYEGLLRNIKQWSTR